MDPLVTIRRHDVLAQRSFAVDEHVAQLKKDKQLVRSFASNKIKKDPKKSYKRHLKRYKKGKMEKRFLRNHPEYESYAFKKWMRPPDYLP